MGTPEEEAAWLAEVFLPHLSHWGGNLGLEAYQASATPLSYIPQPPLCIFI